MRRPGRPPTPVQADPGYEAEPKPDRRGFADLERYKEAFDEDLARRMAQR
jgi:hypothetical protein